MRTFFILLLVFFTFSAFACKNSIPESEAQRYIAAAALGEGVPALFTCADKPNEPCLCFDEIEGWDVAEIVDGKLQNNLEKMAAKRQKLEIEASNKAIAEAKKEAAAERLKLFDRSKSYTNAQLKEFIGDLIEASK